MKFLINALFLYYINAYNEFCGYYGIIGKEIEKKLNSCY